MHAPASKPGEHRASDQGMVEVGQRARARARERERACGRVRECHFHPNVLGFVRP
jgi:hypothetical protein